VRSVSKRYPLIGTRPHALKAVLIVLSICRHVFASLIAVYPEQNLHTLHYVLSSALDVAPDCNGEGGITRALPSRRRVARITRTIDFHRPEGIASIPPPTPMTSSNAASQPLSPYRLALGFCPTPTPISETEPVSHPATVSLRRLSVLNTAIFRASSA
jgi:hypothetical protein